MKKHELKDKRFNRLLVLEEVPNKHHAAWRVRCDCGQERVVAGSDLVSGRTQSCGCFQRERASSENRVGTLSNGTHKTCSRCLRELSVEADFHKSPSTPDGYRTYCKRCVRNATLESKYGITIEAYEALVSEQDNKCFICKSPFSKFKIRSVALDHCHKTGRIRSVLCSGCNTALGLLYEDPVRVKAMLDYCVLICNSSTEVES